MKDIPGRINLIQKVTCDSSESDLDSEIEKCYQILNIKSNMELEICPNSDECDIKFFNSEQDHGTDLGTSPSVSLVNCGNNLNSMPAKSEILDYLKSNNSTSSKTDQDSKLEFCDELFPNINTESSFLNMTGEQFLKLKSDLDSLSEDTNFVKESKNPLENNILTVCNEKNRTDDVDSNKETYFSRCHKDHPLQMSDFPIVQNLKPVLDYNAIFCKGKLQGDLDSVINQTNGLLYKNIESATSNSCITENLKLSTKDDKSVFCDKRLCTENYLKSGNGEISDILHRYELKNTTEINTESNAMKTLDFDLHNSLNLKLCSSDCNLDIEQKALLQNNGNQSHVNIKQERDSKSRVICCKPPFENIDPKNYLSGEKITPEKHQPNNLKMIKDFINISSTKIVSCEKLPGDKKISPPGRKTSETHHPSRIFTLAIKSIDKNENTSSNFNASNKETISPESKTDIINQDISKKNNNLKVSPTNKKPMNSKTRSETDIGSQKILKKGAEIDYLEDEKDDLINPEWDKIKNLTTDEERYQQVRRCWGSREIPDPNKNLSYHSYRKRLFGKEYPEQKSVVQRKRRASTQLNEKTAKRPCTFFLDKEINILEKEKEKKQQEIDEQYFQRKGLLNTPYGYYDSRSHIYCNYTVSGMYHDMPDMCEDKFGVEIHRLNKRRDEVLKFFGFYKGLNASNEDPTQLTEAQFQELDEIENVYKQIDTHYKVSPTK